MTGREFAQAHGDSANWRTSADYEACQFLAAIDRRATMRARLGRLARKLLAAFKKTGPTT